MNKIQSHRSILLFAIFLVSTYVPSPIHAGKEKELSSQELDQLAKLPGRVRFKKLKHEAKLRSTTPLMLAIEQQNRHVVLFLLKKFGQANVEGNICTYRPWQANRRHIECSTTPLLAACQLPRMYDNYIKKRHPKTGNKRIHSRYIMIIERLLEYGADPNLSDRSGDTPLLSVIAHFGNLPRNSTLHGRHILEMAVKPLLKYGANPKLPDKRGATPIRQAMQKYRWNVRDKHFLTIAHLLNQDEKRMHTTLLCIKDKFPLCPSDTLQEIAQLVQKQARQELDVEE